MILDLQFKVQPAMPQAICEITGDVMRLCHAHNGPRPTEFKAGPEITLVTMKRVAPDDA